MAILHVVAMRAAPNEQRASRMRAHVTRLARACVCAAAQKAARVSSGWRVLEDRDRAGRAGRRRTMPRPPTAHSTPLRPSPERPAVPPLCRCKAHNRTPPAWRHRCSCIRCSHLASAGRRPRPPSSSRRCPRPGRHARCLPRQVPGRREARSGNDAAHGAWLQHSRRARRKPAAWLSAFFRSPGTETTINSGLAVADSASLWYLKRGRRRSPAFQLRAFTVPSRNFRFKNLQKSLFFQARSRSSAG